MPSLFTRDEETAQQRKTQRAGSPRVPYARTRWAKYFPTRAKARRGIFYGLLGCSAIFGSLVGLTLVNTTDLPQMEDLEHYHPATTTELLDVHGRSIGSFALERRVVVPYSEFPKVLHDAILSIEDKSFEKNAGINPFRVAGAAYVDLRSKGRRQGASTLTMQLARNLFLSMDQTYSRKIQEILLSIQIERHFTKPQIFALYANQIYLGSGVYGFEAGSEYYFSKKVHDLTLPEAALLAALPKGPTSYSPLRHPERALKRRNLVLSEMLSDGDITRSQYEEAKAAPMGLHIEPQTNTVAPYFVEEVRRQLEQEYGSDAVHGSGLKIFTTMDLDLQLTANKAVMDGAAAYERRHGWKAKLVNIAATGADLETYVHPDWTQSVENGAYFHALVTEATARRVIVRIGKRYAEMTPADWAWTTMGNGDKLLQRGDIAYVRIEDATSGDKTMHATLQQDTGAQAAMMAVDNNNGEVLAMVGGRDFSLSQFNRATQAERQTGSSFKPYVYTAAIENLHTKPTDIIVDGPTSFYTPNGPYTPHNYEADYKGAMTILNAFAESRNIPALKLANQVGIKKVIEVAHRFGVTSNLPSFLPVAIGSAGISLQEQVGAYSVFPNDGILIKPHVIRRIVQADGLPLKQSAPQVKEVVSVDTARTMMKLLEAVPQYGTAAVAGATLKHPLGGKTGTTNSYTDAWFIGFSPSVTAGSWIGFDDRKSLGEKETGAKAALPMWIDFMKAAIARTPVESFPTAAKKTLEVNAGADSVAPVVKKQPVVPNDDSDDDDDSAEKPAVKAPAPVVRETPEAAPDAMPDDSAGSVKVAPSPKGYVASPLGPYRPYTGAKPAAPRTTTEPPRVPAPR
ncbi:penicillin-binding protein, 1A family [Terriglobus roseus DSM 18391]|uniref:Penicillin-binding protein, 1A family n=1 Tax=Terriglobus roseus (strain DSM 18391 / NRRL B-41598 / KBS 63) TaxID=926566 RepID=I3ZL75_TERRK|nr:PBP1A family penicillin-binding protein [Terriglobus roseus]AFL89993.1 penicillin-binding protein, 1A family [Terriglobus roseus DSM 18391]